MSRILTVGLGIQIVLALIAAPIVLAIHQQAQTRNFRVVQPGVLYRSGQLTNEGLKRIINDYRIKTVINLRDGQTRADVAEEEFCKSEEIQFVRILPSQWGDVGGSVPVEAGVRKFREIMSDPKNYPVLVHCFAGIHRTGAYCALYRMEFEHWTNARAIAEMKACGYTNLDDELDILGFMEQYRPTWMPKVETTPAATSSAEVKDKPKTKKVHGRKPSAKGRQKRGHKSGFPA
ncbi:MAG TPA: tyrosine-protein phosphatase [Gemmataceae bacterium]|jgi:protein tyrosine/serine phosphatase